MDYIDLYLSGLSISDVSKETGIPKSTIRFRLKKLGLLRDIKQAIKMAGANGKMSRSESLKKRVISEETRKKMSESKTKRGVGTRINTNGYYEYTMGEHKGRHVHVVLMESIIGRRLFIDECVHHKDHDKLNNDPSNLQLMKKSEHSKHHANHNLKNRERDANGRFK